MFWHSIHDGVVGQVLWRVFQNPEHKFDRNASRQLLNARKNELNRVAVEKVFTKRSRVTSIEQLPHGVEPNVDAPLVVFLAGFEHRLRHEAISTLSRSDAAARKELNKVSRRITSAAVVPVHFTPVHRISCEQAHERRSIGAVSRPSTIQAFLLAALTTTGCAGPTVSESLEAPALSETEQLLDGVPSAASLPEADSKADEVLPANFDLLATQTGVRNQGQRPICSVFAFVAMMESIYMSEGAGTFDFSEASLSHTNGTITAPDNQAGGWPINTNAQTLSSLGVPEESAWRFDGDATAQTAEPPRGYESAARYFVGQGNYINPSTLSVKSHLINQTTPVLAAVRYLRNAWHEHDADAWHRGIVTTPTDAEAASDSPAAHAILLVGWSDEMSAVRRDLNGRDAVDAEGEALIDHGFFLFKNSWGTASWGRDNSRRAGYGWISYEYIARFAATYVSRRASNVPLLEVCDDGSDNDGDVRIDCNDADCRNDAACPDGFANMLTATVGTEIPDANTTGVSSTLPVELDGTISSLRVIVSITHPYRGDVQANLIAPDGTSFMLVDQEGGASDNLDLNISLSGARGHVAAGDWTLHVRDLAPDDVGQLVSWTMLITAN